MAFGMTDEDAFGRREAQPGVHHPNGGELRSLELAGHPSVAHRLQGWTGQRCRHDALAHQRSSPSLHEVEGASAPSTTHTVGQFHATAAAS